MLFFEVFLFLIFDDEFGKFCLIFFLILFVVVNIIRFNIVEVVFCFLRVILIGGIWLFEIM